MANNTIKLEINHQFSAPIVVKIPAWGFAFLEQRQTRATKGSSLTDICSGKCPRRIVARAGIAAQKL